MGKQCSYIFSFLLILLLSATAVTKASNRVTVATIGAYGGMATEEEKTDPQKSVDRMIEFWKAEISIILPSRPDLIVLTEACDRPQGLDDDQVLAYYRVRKDQVLDYFSSVAKANRCYIAFGMKRDDGKGSWLNSCFLLDREGKIAGIYNKNFPTVYEIEEGIKADTDAPVFQCDFGSVACAICFDLNFEELRLKYEKLKPDIIVFPSRYHGGLMQAYWAYSCHSFFVGAVAAQGSPSEIRNPLGEVIATSTNYFHYAVATVNLDSRLVHLDYNWDKLIALKKKYGEKVTVTDPGNVGAVLITSEDNKISAIRMIKEFDIELLDDYFARSREAAAQNQTQGH
jgi:predicted amidohydrolase